MNTVIIILLILATLCNVTMVMVTNTPEMNPHDKIRIMTILTAISGFFVAFALLLITP